MWIYRKCHLIDLELESAVIHVEDIRQRSNLRDLLVICVAIEDNVCLIER